MNCQLDHLELSLSPTLSQYQADSHPLHLDSFSSSFPIPQARQASSPSRCAVFFSTSFSFSPISINFLTLPGISYYPISQALPNISTWSHLHLPNRHLNKPLLPLTNTTPPRIRHHNSKPLLKRTHIIPTPLDSLLNLRSRNAQRECERCVRRVFADECWRGGERHVFGYCAD